MSKNSSLYAFTRAGRGNLGAAQIALGVLLVANVAAAFFVWSPPGGSPEQLEEQMTMLRGQVLQKRLHLDRTRQNVAKVETGRSDGDSFLQNYFLAERTAYSTILGELSVAANQAKIRSKEHAFVVEPIEGSDDLAMMIITGNYEGTYADLMEFINRLDRSSRLVIIESLNATPQQGGAGVLNVNMKLDAFVRHDGSAPESPVQTSMVTQ
jgi:hypothetical protein